MFHVDGGRSVAIHPPGEPATSTGTPAPSLAGDELDDLLGERLMPLRARAGKADEPYLLAVDASGQPVVVEIVAVLNRETLLRAISYAGGAARMSTQDLAHSYQGGAERFWAHLDAFRETVPVTTLLPTTARAGARLLLVCAQIADEVVDAMEFLLQPGWQVKLLQVGVRGADGTRVVDVAPLTRQAPPRRGMEPSLRLVRSQTDQMPVVRHVPTGPLGTRTPGAGVPGQPSRWDQPGGPAPTPAVVPPSFARRVGALDGTAGSAGASGRTGGAAAAAGGPTPATAAPEWQTGPQPTWTPDPGPAETWLDEPTTGHVPVARAAAEDAELTTVMQPAWLQHDPADLPDGAPGAAPRTVGDADRARQGTPTRDATPLHPHPRLLEIVEDLGEPVRLVWTRRRQGRRFVATLRTDGLIELEDRTLVADPGEAATIVSVSAHELDGWVLWRLGSDDGPTLAEALRL